MAKKVGLALGSGSAKGFAHIGVLEVFEENGIPIDMISGCSMGAIIGGFYASGENMYLLSKVFPAMDEKGYLDVTIPRKKGGIVRGDRLEEVIRLFTHDKSFSDTKVPFCCVATDVETGELLVFREGKLHPAIRASMSIPGVFVPVRVDGHLCVDGGVLDRVPCLPLREMGADVVIGVDVGARGITRPLPKQTMTKVFLNCFNIMQWELTKIRTQTADLMICPEVLSLGGLTTEHCEETVRIGRETAERALPDILALLEKNEIPLREKHAPPKEITWSLHLSIENEKPSEREGESLSLSASDFTEE